MALPVSLLTLALSVVTAYALPPSDLRTLSIGQQRDSTSYAPHAATCPSTPLTRPASGLSQAETSYIAGRSPIAAAALKTWLDNTGAGFGQPSTYPTLALASSGGGFRALLSGAGVHQALDGREGGTSVSGLYQALTYESGLSGGGWLLGSIAGNNWPTITNLKTTLWEDTFADGLLLPDNIGVGVDNAEILAAIGSKNAAGYSPTTIDYYGRLLGYALLKQSQGGVADTWSGVTQQSNFTSAAVPFPIITAVGVDGSQGECYPQNPNDPIYELTPYEFGSWDTGDAGFAQMQYIGSRGTSCVTGYDNLGYIMGTSSNVLDGVCLPFPDEIQAIQDVTNAIEDALNINNTADTRAVFAPYPNPFANEPTEIDLVDGGETNQNNPIWPFLHRQIDLLFVSDNSGDENTYPNGTAIHQTYTQAQASGLTRMPAIPESDTFVVQGLNTRPTFFGCNDTNVMTIVWLPNYNFTYASNTNTFKLQYSKTETDAMIANGVAVGSYNGSSTYGTCVGCAILKKTSASLPSACTACFDELCFN